MDTVGIAGLALVVAGVVGYLAGLATASPGRAFAPSTVMAGVTVMAVGRSETSEGAA